MPFVRLFSRAPAPNGTMWCAGAARFLSIELADVMYKQHVFVINVGHPITWEFKKKGRFRRVLKEKDAISFFPSCQPFSGRLKLERDVFGPLLSSLLSTHKLESVISA